MNVYATNFVVRECKREYLHQLKALEEFQNEQVGIYACGKAKINLKMN